MNTLTRNGIAHNLKLSPYEHTIKYENETLTYIFSSELYKNKFIEKIESYREKINCSLTKRFGFEIVNDLLCDIKLYSVTETRGFLIRGKEEYECLNIIRLNGEILTMKS